MAVLSDNVNMDTRGSLPRENMGLPSLDLMDMQGASIPCEYEIESVLGDILMCEIADENEAGEVNRNGIWIKQDITAKMWRVAKVLMVGPEASGRIITGDLVMYPSDKGIPMVKLKRKFIFLNESRVFCVVKAIEKEQSEILSPVKQTPPVQSEPTPTSKRTVSCAGCGKLIDLRMCIKSNNRSWCTECGKDKKPDSKSRGLIKVR